MANVKYSTAALRDLEEIGDYISDELSSPAAALNTVGKIQNTIDKLADFPLIGTSLSAIYADVDDYRFLVCGKYLAFYHTISSDVYIDRVLYGKRDYITILLGDLPSDETE